MGVISPKDKNVATYTIMSIIILLFINSVLMVATAGYQGDNVYTQTVQQFQFLNATFDAQTSQYTTLASNVTADYAAANYFEPVNSALDWTRPLAMIFALPKMIFETGGIFFAIDEFTMGIGGLLGAILTTIVVLWQFSIAYQIAKFILPRLAYK